MNEVGQSVRTSLKPLSLDFPAVKKRCLPYKAVVKIINSLQLNGLHTLTVYFTMYHFHKA